MLMSQQFQCENCRLVFTEQKHLNTHKIKFCKDIDYTPNEFSRSKVNSPYQTKQNITSIQNIPKRSQFNDEDSLTQQIAKQKNRQKQKEKQKAQLLSQLKLLQKQQQKLIELAQYKRPPSQQKQLIQYKDLYKSNSSDLDQFTIDHGKKMAQIKLKREVLERQNQNLDRKLQQNQQYKGASQYNYNNFKQSNVSNMSDNHKGLNQSVIRDRKNNLERLQEEYKKIGGDDPSFYNSIARLQSKYNLQARRPEQVVVRVPTPVAPPSEQNTWMLPFPSRQILPEGSFSSYKPLLIGQTVNKQQTIEERVVASIMAQQYQSLQILSKIPKDSQLYKIKLQQYKQLSKYRQDALKQAHLQRLKKLKNQFQIQRKLDIKQLHNDRWVNEMRKNIINKVKKTGPTSDKMNCGVFLHMVKGMPKSVYQIRINFKILQHSNILLQDDTLGERESKYSVIDGKSASTFNQMINLTIQDKHMLNILIEVSCNSISGRQFRHLGWCLIKLTNSRKKVIENNYKLPLFQYPVDYNVYLNRGNNRRVFPQMFVYLKIFQQQPNNYRDYVEPRYQSEEIYLNDDDIEQYDQKYSNKQEYSQPNKPKQTQIIEKKNVVGFRPKNISLSNRGYSITIISLNTTHNPEDLLLQVLILAEQSVLHDQNNNPIRLQISIQDEGQKHYNKKSVRLNQVLRVNIDLEKLYNQIQRDFYLMMILKNKTLEESKNTVGWNCYKLTNFHKVREGDAVVRLVKDELTQIPFDMNMALEQTEDEVHIRMDWVQIIEKEKESRSSKRTKK